MNRILVGCSLGVMLLSGCGVRPVSAQQGVEVRVQAKAEVRSATVDEARAMIASDPQLIVLDVREAHEFEAGHIQGALLRPLGQVSNWSKALDKDAAYLVVCRSGHRSGLASARLASFGFTNVTNMTGGMLGWSAAGYPSVVGNR